MGMPIHGPGRNTHRGPEPDGDQPLAINPHSHFPNRQRDAGLGTDASLAFESKYTSEVLHQTAHQHQHQPEAETFFPAEPRRTLPEHFEVGEVLRCHATPGQPIGERGAEQLIVFDYEDGRHGLQVLAALTSR